MATNGCYCTGVTGVMGEEPVPVTGMVDVAWRVVTVGVYPRERFEG